MGEVRMLKALPWGKWADSEFKAQGHFPRLQYSSESLGMLGKSSSLGPTLRNSDAEDLGLGQETQV